VYPWSRELSDPGDTLNAKVEVDNGIGGRLSKVGCGTFVDSGTSIRALCSVLVAASVGTTVSEGRSWILI